MNQEPKTVNESLAGIQETLTEIRERITKIETNAEWTRKALEGNGKPGLIDRVNAMEKGAAEARGGSRLKARIVAAALTVILAAMGWGLTLWSNFHKSELAIAEQQRTHDAQTDTRLNDISDRLSVMERARIPVRQQRRAK